MGGAVKDGWLSLSQGEAMDEERVTFLLEQMRNEIAWFDGRARAVASLASSLKAYIAELEAHLDEHVVEEMRSYRNVIEVVNAVCIEEGHREPTATEMEDVRRATADLGRLIDENAPAASDQ